MLLTQVRKELGLSQAGLSRKAAICQSTLSQIESGRLLPYPRQLARLAQALNWKGNPEELLGATPANHQQNDPSVHERSSND